MNIISDVYGVHEQALRARDQRMGLLATNIANAETPKFKAKDIDFKVVMGQVQKDSINTTHTRHFDVHQSNANPDGIKYRVPLSASADSNTVEMSVEQAKFGKAAADYRATLMFIENRTSSIKRALRGE
jgi:flagellar basal-body rod protein FlgB